MSGLTLLPQAGRDEEAAEKPIKHFLQGLKPIYFRLYAEAKAPAS
jgi:hypothetical protein